MPPAAQTRVAPVERANVEHAVQRERRRIGLQHIRAQAAQKILLAVADVDYGFDKWDAYMLLSQCGRVRLGNFVDPKYTIGAAISKKYLA